MSSGLGPRTCNYADDMAQLGAGSVLPLGPMASSARLEERPEENLHLLAEAADLLIPPHRSTPQPDAAGLTPDLGTTRRLHASKANSEPPLYVYQRQWQSLRVTADVHHISHPHLEDATPPHTATSSLLPVSYTHLTLPTIYSV